MDDPDRLCELIRDGNHFHLLGTRDMRIMNGIRHEKPANRAVFQCLDPFGRQQPVGDEGVYLLCPFQFRGFRDLVEGPATDGEIVDDQGALPLTSPMIPRISACSLCDVRCLLPMARGTPSLLA